MWPFKSAAQTPTIYSEVIRNQDGTVTIDVRGQTCPGYLLSINKAMDTLADGTQARLLSSYAPCGEDVEAWCHERGYQYGGTFQDDRGMWNVAVTK